MKNNYAHQNYSSLQIIRAAAAWLVVYHHFMQIYFGFKSESAIGLFFAKYGNIGVDVFFVLSGFVMHLSATKDGQKAGLFMLDRFFRIIPVYWFYTLTIPFFIFIFPDEFSFTSYDLKSITASLLFIPTQNPSGIGEFPLLPVGWSLNFEMFFYSILTVSLVLNKKISNIFFFTLIILLPVVYPKNFTYSIVASSKLLYEFLAGVLIAYLFQNKKFNEILIKKRHLFIALSLISLTTISIFLKNYYALRLPLAGSIVLFALLIEPYINKKSSIIKVLVSLGNESYSTYLSHTILLSILLHFTGRNLSSPGLILTIIISSLLIWFISKMSYIYIEKNSKLKTIKYKINKNILFSSNPI